MNVAVALVGLGDIGMRAHLPALRREPRLELRALVDTDPARREAAAAATGGEVPLLDSLEAVLADETIGAVVLATPPWATTALARRTLEASRFVLAEKPVATSSDAARPLRELPAALIARFQAGMTYRHDPALARLRGWIVEGRLGRPLLVRAHIYDERRDPGDPEHAARIVAALRHGLPALHEGAHVFDWISFLLGGPLDAADAWALRTDAALPAPNLCGARLRTADGDEVLTEFGWFTDRLPRCELTFLGPSGLATLAGSTFDLTLETAAGRETFAADQDRQMRCFALQLTRFVDLVTGRAPAPSPSLGDALATLDLAERVGELAGVQRGAAGSRAALA